MAKLIQMPHHSNCNCCGRQASFTELARRPSGFGPMKSSSSSAPAQKRPNTHHGTGAGIMKNQERKVSERVGSANQRRKSLQHGSESTSGTSAQKTFDVLSRDVHNAEEIVAEIAEAVAQRSMLQATESRMKGTSRDKESLLEECLALKEALCDQLYHLQLHRVHHETVEGEQSKMEVAIQELEMAHGLQAPRTGDPSQLRARIKGLKCRQQEYHNVMIVQQDDIELLKKDTRVSFTKEASVERDVFATETRRLQKMIRRLQVFYHKICNENNEVVRLRETIAKLNSKLSKIEMKIKNTKSIIVQMKIDIDQAKADSYEAQRNTKYAVSKAGELESHSQVLQRILTREKEEGNRIHKQTCALGEQIRIVRKENADRAAQATLAAGMLAMDAQKRAGGKGGKKAGKIGKLKDFDTDSASSKDLSAVRSSPSSPATPSSQSTVNKEFDEIRANYIKAIGKATDTFVETAPGSGSPRATPHPDIGDHSGYEELQTAFQRDVGDAEDKFMDMMDTLEYGAARPRRDLEAEARRLREQLEALQKQQMSISKFLESLTIELDDKTLKIGEYVVDVKDTQTSVKITSPDKTPEALARKTREAEEAARRAAEEEAKRKKAAEDEAARRAAEEEEARRKKAAEDEAGRKKKEAEDEAARKKREAEEEAARKKKEAEDEAMRKKKEAEDAAKKKKEAEDEATRKKREAEEEAARKKKEAEDEAMRKKKEAEDAAKKKKEAEDEATRKKREAEEEAARKKKEAEDEAMRKKKEAEDAARKKKEVEDKKGKGLAGAGAGGVGKEKDEFFNEEMQGTIKENIKEVLGHLEVISKTVQQKATPSGTAESSAQDILKKLDEPSDKSK